MIVQKPKTFLAKKYLFIAALVLLFISSSIYIIDISWDLPLSRLFSKTELLPPQAIIAQMTIIAQTGVSLFTGGLLAVVSILLQQIVRNNLASETTLSIGSGAQLSTLAVIIFFPSLAMYGNFWVALLGALFSLSLVLGIAMHSKINPMVLIMAGLVVNILFTALVGLLMVFYSNYISSLMVWAMGYLVQDNWSSFLSLAIISCVTLCITFIFHKPLMIMSLDDEQARMLGVSVKAIRTFVFLGCAVVTAFVVSCVGLIGFIGLGAATVVNVLNIRKVRARLLVSFVIGALLLGLTNNCIVILEHFVTLPKAIPAGALTGFLGAPIVLWLIIKQRSTTSTDDTVSQIILTRKTIHWKQFIIALLLVFVVALFYINSNTGWYFDSDLLTAANRDILHYRLVRTITAATTGVMLAVAGLLLQRMTQNPMASPEVLGISSASAIAMVIAYIIMPMASPLVLFGFGLLGSGLIMIFLIWLMRSVSANHLLLVGIAIGAIMNGFMMIMAFIGDPRLQAVLGWLSGSTYHAQPSVALILVMICITVVCLTLMMTRPINILSLNEGVARSLGLSVKMMQTVVLVLVAVMSTFATMAIGPLSFIGLMTPHLATSLGATQTKTQLPLAAILGAIFMIVADWIGRYILFPFEVAAGTLASIIGCVYFLFLIRKIY